VHQNKILNSPSHCCWYHNQH